MRKTLTLDAKIRFFQFPSRFLCKLVVEHNREGHGWTINYRETESIKVSYFSKEIKVILPERSIIYETVFLERSSGECNRMRKALLKSFLITISMIRANV